MKLQPRWFFLAALLMVVLSATAPAKDPDPNFYVFLCFGQSNMEGFPGIEQQDKTAVDRFTMLAAVDFPKLNRKKGEWYPAVAAYFSKVAFSNNSILQPATETLTTPTLILFGSVATRVLPK